MKNHVQKNLIDIKCDETKNTVFYISMVCLDYADEIMTEGLSGEEYDEADRLSDTKIQKCKNSLPPKLNIIQVH